MELTDEQIENAIRCESINCTMCRMPNDSRNSCTAILAAALQAERAKPKIDKYEQATKTIMNWKASIEQDEFPTVLENFLRSQFPEPAKSERVVEANKTIDGVRELVMAVRSVACRSSTTGWSNHDEERERLITAFINAREAGKCESCTKCHFAKPERLKFSVAELYDAENQPLPDAPKD